MSNAEMAIREAVAETKTDVQSLIIDLRSAGSRVRSLTNVLSAGQSTLATAKGDLARTQGLVRQGVLPEVAAEEKQGVVNAAIVSVSNSQAELADAQGLVEQLELQLQQAEAATNKTPEQLLRQPNLPPVVQNAVQNYRSAKASLDGLGTEAQGKEVKATVAGILVGLPPVERGRMDFNGDVPSFEANFGLEPGETISPEGQAVTRNPTILITKRQEDVDGNVSELSGALYYTGLDPSNMAALNERKGQRVGVVAPDGTQGTGMVSKVLTQGQSLGGSVWVTDFKDTLNRPMEMSDNLAMWQLFLTEEPKPTINVDNGDQVKISRSFGAERSRFKFPTGNENVTVTIPVYANDNGQSGRKLGDIEVRYVASSDAKSVEIKDPLAVFTPVGNAVGSAIDVTVSMDDVGGKLQAGNTVTGVRDSRAILRMTPVITTENRSVSISGGVASTSLAPNATALNLEFGVIPSGEFPRPAPIGIPPSHGGPVHYPLKPLTTVVNLPEKILINDPSLLNSR